MGKLFLSVLFLAASLLAQPFPHTMDVTIAAGASLSSAVNVREGSHPSGSCTPTALIMSGTWATATVITVQVSTDGTTYQNLYDQFGNEISITVAASRTVKLDAADLWGAGLSFKFRSGTAASAVNQAAGSFKLVCR